MYISGGVNRWIGENWGIRIEGRDQIVLEGETSHLLEVRFAIIGG